MNRRIFLLAGTGAALAQSPSKRLVLGLIGSGGRGRAIMGFHRQDADVTVGAVCDIYEPNLERGLSEAGGGAKAYRNYKELLADPNIDIVVIASPEHWHHRMLLDALAAGKDIYIEKPLCHTWQQGVELVRAVRGSKNIVQVGMQRRSYQLYQQARDMRREGKLGTVRMVRSYWLNNGLSPSPRTFEGPVDWQQWLGPAPAVPQDSLRFFNWRDFSDYSGGIVMDQGAHIYDAIHMIMDAGYPSAVTAAAGKPHKPGVDQPESWVVTAEYPEDFVAVFTINYAAMKYPQAVDQLNAYDGDEARMDLGREVLRVFPRSDPETAAVNQEQPGGFGQATIDHVKNFLQCVRTRATPVAPVETGFQSALVLQMANLSVRQGRKARWNRDEMRVEL
jgi:predicted dehydrogenase